MVVLTINPAWTAFAASDLEERRTRIAMQLFRTALAADTRLGEKLGTEQQLRVLILYRDDRLAAEQASQDLLASGRGDAQGKIGSWPVSPQVMSVADFVDSKELDPVAGIFLMQDLPTERLQKVIDFGTRRGLIVYSSVEGHVERGVLAGINVGVRVLPYLNMAALRASGLALRPLFLKVAKQHE